MAEFLLLYRVPQGYENDQADVAAWNTWLALLGDDLLDVGQPIVEATTVGRPGPQLRLTGFSKVAAHDRAAAEEIASRCPAVACGGAVEVGTIVPMPAGHGPG